MRAIALTSLLIIAAFRSDAATTITVQQLEDALASARSEGRSDKKVAGTLAKVTLTERLTDSRLATLSGEAPGDETQEELHTLAAWSAFLLPPASELPTDAKPPISEQKLIIARATNYAAHFVHSLPNFICEEVIRRLDDNPLGERVEKTTWNQIRLRDTIVQQLTFYHGKESSVIRTVNGRADTDSPDMTGMSTRGEFGNMLSAMFFGDSAMKAWWSRWEMVDGKQLAVFKYAVDRAHSSYAVNYCCTAIVGPGGRRLPNTIVVAFHGELFIDPVSGTIARATWRSVNVPEGFPTRQTGTVVEYRAVDIGGKSYICPVKSLTLSDSLVYTADGSHSFPVHSINEARFMRYRKFETEATFMTGQARGEDSWVVIPSGVPPPLWTVPDWLFAPTPPAPPFLDANQ